jgi:hypothetical protein
VTDNSVQPDEGAVPKVVGSLTAALTLTLALAGCIGTVRHTHVLIPVVDAGGFSIATTNVRRSGNAIEVNFQADDPGSTNQRFVWGELVVTAPDGTRHTAVRDRGSAPYKMVTAGSGYSSRALFQFPTLTRGIYSLSYAGVRLSYL